MPSDTHDMKKESKIYIGVFIALLIGTAITVSAGYLKVGIALAITIALTIATIKGSLVATYFMHLRSEKKVIYYILILTLILFLVMMILIPLMYYNVYEGLKHVS